MELGKFKLSPMILTLMVIAKIIIFRTNSYFTPSKTTHAEIKRLDILSSNWGTNRFTCRSGE